MTESTSPTRHQLVAGAADMMRRRGLNATSVREVAKHSRTPQGSTYHYFPGGKQQLATEAVRFAGDSVAGILAAKLEAGPVAGLRAFFQLWREILTSTDFQAGCPVLAAAVEAPPDGERPEVLDAATAAFTGWETQLADSMRHHGADADAAGSVATLIVAAAEGAVAMCRAQHHTRPLDRVAAELEILVGKAIDG
ncbi:TetR/AcrR family transcriptional regulator [Amycolatopsis sp. 195334CR]|uniref:TetR/AcrR family transcriptional regulator n=1 Tax=Amycolatopsis sp. 195334CR TaxID=2814588 RepID=UPI001A8E4FA1|nr:helix-turn-helix domain-containing protein [Amycolatopsis sp. 195334CR]MBN6038131.1 TetR/AcrR family transcriptional regulator [Amycolatopsis sp. 195334CR]